MVGPCAQEDAATDAVRQKLWVRESHLQAFVQSKMEWTRDLERAVALKSFLWLVLRPISGGAPMHPWV